MVEKDLFGEREWKILEKNSKNVYNFCSEMKQNFQVNDYAMCETDYKKHYLVSDIINISVLRDFICAS